MKNIPKIMKISRNYYNQLKRCQVFLWSYYVNIYRDINENLRKSKKENYLIFIKVLYEGIRLKALPLAS